MPSARTRRWAMTTIRSATAMASSGTMTCIASMTSTVRRIGSSSATWAMTNRSRAAQAGLARPSVATRGSVAAAIRSIRASASRMTSSPRIVTRPDRSPVERPQHHVVDRRRRGRGGRPGPRCVRAPARSGRSARPRRRPGRSPTAAPGPGGAPSRTSGARLREAEHGGLGDLAATTASSSAGVSRVRSTVVGEGVAVEHRARGPGRRVGDDEASTKTISRTAASVLRSIDRSLVGATGTRVSARVLVETR